MALWLSMRGVDPYPLEPGVDVTIGRGRSCELSLYSSLLSREHARIRWENEEAVLFDLGSLNGCYVGVDKVLRHTLRPGDTVRLGDLVIQVSESAAPPAPIEEGQTRAYDPRPEVTPCANETRMFTRTSAMHEEVFDYDELAWLAMRVEEDQAAIAAPSLLGEDLGAWLSEAPEREAALWRLLAAGVVAPVNAHEGERGMDAATLAGLCKLTARGEKLRKSFEGRRTHWNEMASLRYRARQCALFRPLRSVARAYRPGRGIEDLTLTEIVYELGSIYAADLAPEALELELRRMLVLGVFAAQDDAKSAAWYPGEWTEEVVGVSRRGYALLAGFRLDDDEGAGLA